QLRARGDAALAGPGPVGAAPGDVPPGRPGRDRRGAPPGPQRAGDGRRDHRVLRGAAPVAADDLQLRVAVRGELDGGPDERRDDDHRRLRGHRPVSGTTAAPTTT